MKKSHKGRFRPENPDKYAGDANNIIYRSSWERSCMIMFDRNPNILEWNSEEIVVPYMSPLDGKMHRYYPDFVVLLKDREGHERVVMIEVKPYKQTQPPERKSRITKKFLNETTTYAVNQAKWEAAKKYCEKRGIEFKIITERNLGF